MINPNVELLYSVGWTEFQFHIGMINPELSLECCIVVPPFQFHIGMINPKSLCSS